MGHIKALRGKHFVRSSKNIIKITWTGNKET